MKFPLETLRQLPTPCYYYDMDLLRQTCTAAMVEAAKYGIKVHYALKANANRRILETISALGMGADCVSAAEVCRAAECGFGADTIAFAGVGKTDAEIAYACAADIWCFNCESPQEIKVIDSIAGGLDRRARIALRINPNVDAHTHSHITTGVEQSKFGIQLWEIPETLRMLKRLLHVDLVGLHFHIGSQITDMQAIAALCRKVNEIMAQHDLFLQHINLGGGLAIDYAAPDEHAMPDFAAYFTAIGDNLEELPGQQVHVELGRSIVGQCGSLLTKALYIKPLHERSIIIVDAGMTDLIRPALYDAYHCIENLTSAAADTAIYDVAGPICESTDFFARSRTLTTTERGDILAIRSAGAYGEAMASQYNLRALPSAVYSDAL